MKTVDPVNKTVDVIALQGQSFTMIALWIWQQGRSCCLGHGICVTSAHTHRHLLSLYHCIPANRRRLHCLACKCADLSKTRFHGRLISLLLADWPLFRRTCTGAHTNTSTCQHCSAPPHAPSLRLGLITNRLVIATGCEDPHRADTCMNPSYTVMYVSACTCRYMCA